MRRTWAPDAWLRLTAVLPRPRARGAVMMFAVLILNTCQGRAVCRWRCECTRIATVEATALRTSIDIPYLALHAYCGGFSAICRERIYQLNSYLAPEGRTTNRNRRPAHMAREVDGQNTKARAQPTGRLFAIRPRTKRNQAQRKCGKEWLQATEVRA
jgi:hypothetical protein